MCTSLSFYCMVASLQIHDAILSQFLLITLSLEVYIYEHKSTFLIEVNEISKQIQNRDTRVKMDKRSEIFVPTEGVMVKNKLIFPPGLKKGLRLQATVAGVAHLS